MNKSVLLFVILSFCRLYGQSDFYKNGLKALNKKQYEYAETLFNTHLKYFEKDDAFSYNRDTIFDVVNDLSELYKSKGLNPGIWYTKMVQYSKEFYLKPYEQSSGPRLKMIAIAAISINDTIVAGEAFRSAYYSLRQDSVLLYHFGEYLYSVQKYKNSVEMFDKLNHLYHLKHPLYDNALDKLKNYQTNNKTSLLNFRFDLSTLFYFESGDGVYAYNADSHQTVKIYDCDSLMQRIDGISLKDNQTLEVEIHGPWGHQYRYQENAVKNLSDDYWRPTTLFFKYYKDVVLNNGETYLSRINILKEFGYMTYNIDTNFQIIDHFFDKDSNVTLVRDSILSTDEWNYVRNGNWDPFTHMYFYYLFETQEYNGRKIVSDTSGLWLIENGKQKILKPFKMTYYGHFPMGFVEPDLSNDGKWAVFKDQVDRPWEEFYFPRSDSSSIKRGFLTILNLDNMEEKRLTPYNVYYPRFSDNINYIAYRKATLPLLQKDMLEIYDLKLNQALLIRTVDGFIWYKYK